MSIAYRVDRVSQEAEIAYDGEAENGADEGEYEHAYFHHSAPTR
jgi:hypothetical protein